ncbi:MAG: ribonuclease Z [Marinobacter sp.]|nr:ribonuclease Z [Marinobacter sp.]
MHITFLGTSAGTPTKARNVSALALQYGKPRAWYLVDCGEGTQHRLLMTRHSLLQLQAIFITHVHGDHTFGLPGVLASASMSGRTAPLSVIAPPGVQRFVEAALGNTDSALSYPVHFLDSEQPSFHWQDDALAVSTAPLSHRVPCHAFVFTEKRLERQLDRDRLNADGVPAGPVWGELQRGHDLVLLDGRTLRADDYTRIERVPRRIVVAGDNDTPDLLANACEGAQLLIHEATYTQAVADRVGPLPQHSSAAQVARFAEQAGLPHLALTHFSARYQANPALQPYIGELEAEARAHYHGNLVMAKDLDTYELTPNLSLTKRND